MVRAQGVLAQCRLALVPDGLMLGALFGGDTLQVGGWVGCWLLCGS